jgi:hypothetical protein
MQRDRVLLQDHESKQPVHPGPSVGDKRASGHIRYCGLGASTHAAPASCSRRTRVGGKNVWDSQRGFEHYRRRRTNHCASAQSAPIQLQPPDHEGAKPAGQPIRPCGLPPPCRRTNHCASAQSAPIQPQPPDHEGAKPAGQLIRPCGPPPGRPGTQHGVSFDRPFNFPVLNEEAGLEIPMHPAVPVCA